LFVLFCFVFFSEEKPDESPEPQNNSAESISVIIPVFAFSKIEKRARLQVLQLVLSRKRTARQSRIVKEELNFSQSV